MVEFRIVGSTDEAMVAEIFSDINETSSGHTLSPPMRPGGLSTP
jgi:hypothetical protein